MRVAFLSTYFDDSLPSSAALLERSDLHRELPLELAARGHEVTCILSSGDSVRLRREKVPYVFLRESRSTVARSVAPWVRREPVELETPANALEEVARFAPDLLHFHGTVLHWHLRAVRRRFPDLPLFIQHHGGDPARHPLTSRLQRENFAGQTVLFSAPEHAEPFLAAGSLSDPKQAAVFMESSSTFFPRDKLLARTQTGMTGEPVCLSVARLEDLKDPFTLLEGFALILRDRPRARLYLCYTTTTLLEAMKSRAEELGISRSLFWLGSVPHDELEWIYSSADFFLQCSRREWSGYASLEAVACGVTPVLTNIPSFRQVTGNGAIGTLFELGDAEALANAVLSVPRDEYESNAVAVRDHFERRLSFAALAQRLEAIYRRRFDRPDSEVSS